MAQLGEAVWSRGRDTRDTMTLRGYVGVLSFFTTYGLALASAVAYLTLAWQPTLVSFLLVGLVVPFAGIFIAHRSDNWLVSLFGYTLLVLGLGAVTGPAVAMYKANVVMTALLATSGVTVVMSLAGILYPKSLESWGSYLFGALLALLFVRIAQLVMLSLGYPSFGYMPLIEYGAAVLFSLYIVYDWNRAVRLSRTLDNAVDCAMAIFLDVINLFLTMLRIFGHSSSD